MNKILLTVSLTGLSLGVSAATLFAASSAIAQHGGACSTDTCDYYYGPGEFIEGFCGPYGPQQDPAGCACWVWILDDWYFQPQQACNA